MAKPGYIQIAEHFGTSSENVREMAYQPGRFTKPVYHYANTLYAAGKTAPREIDGDRKFQKIESWTGYTIWEEVKETK